MKRFVFSDSHGGYKAMIQCLERCGFEHDKDQLFFIGDVVDGWSQTKECIELLLSIPNLVHLLGNHDQWAIKAYTGEFFKPESEDKMELELWLQQGGAATAHSYDEGIPGKHLEFLLNAKPYYVTEDNILLVHAGFDPDMPIENTNPDHLIWNRTFIHKYYKLFSKNKYKPLPKPDDSVPQYKEIYVGHTPTISFDTDQTVPLQMGNIILMDTGAAFTGRLSIMDMDTKEVWQSDLLMTLYPDEQGRNGISWNELQQEQAR